MPNSYLVTGMVVSFDGGESYMVLCKDCYDEIIDELRKDKNITSENPIFLGSETIIPYICETCQEQIDCEVIE